jgi:hypothetical protein
VKKKYQFKKHVKEKKIAIKKIEIKFKRKKNLRSDRQTK